MDAYVPGAEKPVMKPMSGTDVSALNVTLPEMRSTNGAEIAKNAQCADW